MAVLHQNDSETLLGEVFFQTQNWLFCSLHFSCIQWLRVRFSLMLKNDQAYTSQSCCKPPCPLQRWLTPMAVLRTADNNFAFINHMVWAIAGSTGGSRQTPSKCPIQPYPREKLKLFGTSIVPGRAQVMRGQQMSHIQPPLRGLKAGKSLVLAVFAHRWQQPFQLRPQILWSILVMLKYGNKAFLTCPPAVSFHQKACPKVTA